jgi:hypothetical protein
MVIFFSSVNGANAFPGTGLEKEKVGYRSTDARRFRRLSSAGSTENFPGIVSECLAGCVPL